MVMLKIRNLPDIGHRSLRMRTAQHRQRTKAEVRENSANAVKPEAPFSVEAILVTYEQEFGLATRMSTLMLPGAKQRN